MSIPVLPQALINDIAKGRVVLMLGAGASYGASNASNTRKAPMGTELAKLIQAEFFPGRKEFGTADLDYISELAISTTNAGRVQRFIREQFLDLEPTDSIIALTDYVWHGISTTNYDLLVEKAFEKTGKALTIFRSDKDEHEIGSTTAYLKLHGCIDTIGPDNPPLILTRPQFIEYLSGRERIFKRFVEWAQEYTVLYIGFRLQDWDFLEIQRKLREELKDHLPRAYAFRPDVTPEEISMWEQKKVTFIPANFAQFIEALSLQIPKSTMALTGILPIAHPMESRLKITGNLTPGLQKLLDSVEYLHENTTFPAEHDLPERQFYRGANLGWKAIINDLDVHRHLLIAAKKDLIERLEHERPGISDVYVILAAAGEGKTVFLRRLAIEASRLGRFCFFAIDRHNIPIHGIQQVFDLSDERVFLFIDDAPDRAQEIYDLARSAREKHWPLTIITTARTNEYTLYCEPVDKVVNEILKITRLSDKEVRSLVQLMNRYDALGNLKPLSEDESVAMILGRLDRQLLPALYTATEDRNFEEIVIDEYFGIARSGNSNHVRAQELYRAIAVLHRLRMPVRSGLIARTFGIRFTEFETEFLNPLKNIVFSRKLDGELVYETRHPEIARIIFERAFADSSERFDTLIRLLSGFNLTYTSDKLAFQHISSYRSSRNFQFTKTQSNSFYSAAFEVSRGVDRDEAFVLQQEALYAMNVDNNLEWAESRLTEGLEMKKIMN
jgi:SIR2-like domain